ncbi:hypothetical protein [Billgrantia antri]|uniref:Uncharacterized protein n=1 Tax=Billgrantia antri TaxID=2846777 RepID=A0ABS6ZLQ7_9GAMM|nr:hypothetical protein [Halomonas antri]MBW6391002.1 hypothetical protein [Halomonas antri]
MSIPMPFSLVVKVACWVWGYVTRFLFLKTFRRSHEAWARRHHLGARWIPLGSYLEYSLQLAKPIDAGAKVSKLAFRSKKHNILNLEVFFEAVGGGIRYQEKICLSDIDERPIVCSMVNVPCQELITLSNNKIMFSIESVQFRKCQVELEGGEVVSQFDSQISYLTHSWLMHDEWKFRWGVWWNCNSIKWAKQRLQDYWRWGFLAPKFRVISPSTVLSRREPLWMSGVRAIGWLMGRPWLVTMQFWVAIWSGLFILNDEDELQWRWQKTSTNDSFDSEI